MLGVGRFEGFLIDMRGMSMCVYITWHCCQPHMDRIHNIEEGTRSEQSAKKRSTLRSLLCIFPFPSPFPK